MSSPEEDRSPLDEMLDLFVYAPVGVALTAAEELPKMVDRGREAMESNLGKARALGRVAVNQGRVEVSRIVSQWNDLGAVLRSGAMNPPRAPRQDRDGAPAALHSSAPPVEATPVPTEAVRTPVDSKPRVRPRAKRAPAAPASLGIPGYESLSASQVVSRLDGLTVEQRQAVKEYESSTRRRSTILGRIAQIESGSAR